jgi:hypothetical protein
MVGGKCKRKTDAFLSAASDAKRKPRKRKDKLKKPFSERRGPDSGPYGSGTASQEDSVDGLADFFSILNAADGQGADSSLDFDNVGDLREIRDVGVLARDLIRRIQSLRTQFRPGSMAALALPDLQILEDLPEVREGSHEGSSGTGDGVATDQAASDE